MPQYLHLDYRPVSGSWVLRLQTRLRGSSAGTVRDAYSRWAALGLGELGLAIATKLAIRDRVAVRLNQLLRELGDQVSAIPNLEEQIELGAVFTPKDENLFYDICATVDSLYFESRSAYEIVGEFVRRVARDVLGREVTEEELVEYLKGWGESVAWISDLRENRKLFFHQTAPWIALQIEVRDPLTFKLVVMKENLHEFTDPTKFVTQDQMAEMWRGFESAMMALEEWILLELQRVEREAAE